MTAMRVDSLLASPGPGFDEPLELLSACHGRIEAQLATLLKLADHVPQHGADEQARQAAANIMRYFDTAGVNHHADEEVDLFPLIARIASEEREIEIMLLVDELAAEHRVMEQGWRALREALQTIEGGTPAPLPGPQVEEFAALYRRHIAREEELLLPYAALVLLREQCEQLGRSMAARRGAAAPDGDIPA